MTPVSNTHLFFQVCGYVEDEDGEGRLTGTEFFDVDLTELEWADYDEKSNQSTVISGSQAFLY